MNNNPQATNKLMTSELMTDKLMNQHHDKELFKNCLEEPC